MPKTTQIRNTDRIGLSYVIGQGPSSAKVIVDSAILAEKTGFDVVLMPEHYYDRDAPSILGAIAQSTSKIKIGTGIINPYSRFPSLIAMTVATLSELTGGRVILGLGSGSVIGSSHDGIPNEFAKLQYEFPLGHLKELVPIIRRLLAGQEVTFHGQFYSLDNVKLSLLPVKQKIPVYFGQQGQKMMEFAGHSADGVLITLCCTVPYCKNVIQRVEESEKANGRKKGSVDFAARIITCLSDDPRKALNFAKRVVGRVFINPGAKPVMELSGINVDVKALKRAADRGREDELMRLVPDEVADMATASGTKKHIKERIEEYREAGVTLPLIVPIGDNYSEVIRCFK
jgi:5,10-methylenetetrahydromethanopterin reductase